jgi:Skp family chaperone for outer membrane proteins
MTEKIKGFDEDYRNERIQINQEITDGLKERFQKEFDAQIEQSRRLYESSVDFMQNTVGSFFNERELLKQNKQSELQDIMSAYQQDLISHEEMVARKLKVEEDYSRKVSNLRNSLNKDIINSAINTAGQYLQTWINTYIAKQQAEYVTSLGKTGMSALAGGLLSVGAGLLVGGTLAFLSYQATKKYKESDTSSYMPISASGQSDSERKRFGGIAGASIQYLNIIPTVSFESSNVWIAAGSVESFNSELSEMMLQTMQDAIDGNQLDLTGISPQ